MMLSRTGRDRDPSRSRSDQRGPAGTMGLCGGCALTGDRISSSSSSSSLCCVVLCCVVLCCVVLCCVVLCCVVLCCVVLCCVG